MRLASSGRSSSLRRPDSMDPTHSSDSARKVTNTSLRSKSIIDSQQPHPCGSIERAEMKLAAVIAADVMRNEGDAVLLDESKRSADVPLGEVAAHEFHLSATEHLRLQASDRNV